MKCKISRSPSFLADITHSNFDEPRSNIVDFHFWGTDRALKSRFFLKSCNDTVLVYIYLHSANVPICALITTTIVKVSHICLETLMYIKQR